MAGELFIWQTWSMGMGMAPWLLGLIFIWSIAWKGFALWKAAKKESKTWFVILLLVNTVGLLEIFYIFVFSKYNPKSGKAKSAKKKK